MLDAGNDPRTIHYGELPLFSAFISSDSGARMASAFILRVGVHGAPWDRYYSHAYIVTALHAVYDKFRGEPRRGVRLEFPWMEEQGLATVPLDGYQWEFVRPGDLPDQESALDIAVSPLKRAGFTGLQFGRSVRAVDVDICEIESDYSLLGRETVSVGLFSQHDGSSDHIEPILRFGRVAATPKNVLNTAFGKVKSILVESSSAEGMSGAPVFSRTRSGDWRLLGVHTGHYNSEQEVVGGNAAATVGVHSAVGFVVPANRLLGDIVFGSELRRARGEVSSEIDMFPWRFIDRRHRESRGVVFAEAYFANMVEYAEYGMRGSATYLFYRLRVLDSYDDRFAKGDELEWNTDVHAPLGDGGSVLAALEGKCGSVSWNFKEDRLWRGTFSLGEEVIAIDVFLDPQSQVLAFSLASTYGEMDVETLMGIGDSLGGPPLKIIDLTRGWEV